MHKVGQGKGAPPRTLLTCEVLIVSEPILGIDIAKAKFDVCLLQNERFHHRQFANNPPGFVLLDAWLASMGAGTLHACLEATSTYGLALAQHLHSADHKVSVVNPFQIKAFANSTLRRTKTDRVDAKTIARFCQALRPMLWHPTPPETAQLQALVRRLEALQAMHGQERNRLQVPGLLPEVRSSIEAMLATLEAHMATMRQQIKEHIDRHPDLKAQKDLLTSIPGIGQSTAQVLLAEVGDFGAYSSARALAAQAGLVPAQHQSGSSVRGKAFLSKRGNSRLRHALYWPAIVALRKNPLLVPFAQRKRAEGKDNLVIIAAAMRRLLHLAFGVLRHRRPFDPNYLPSRT
jgi:transposase